jgi:cytochrome c biogenesis protein CcdA
VAESRRQVSFLFGFLTVAMAAALIRGVIGAQTTAGRVAVAVIFGVLLVVFLIGWAVSARRPAHLEITEDSIRYVTGNGRVTALSRQQGDELRFISRPAGRIWTLGLTVTPGPGPVLTPLTFFSRKAVRQACQARGWRFAA